MQRTKLLNINNKNDVLKVISLLKDGQVVAIPTETVYGLAADASNEKAIEKIFIAKNRPTTNPLILHLSDLSQLSKWVQDIPDDLYKLAQYFWPGPLTFLLNKKDKVSDMITAGSSKIAVRIPKNETLQYIIREIGGDGLVAPSANLYTKISPTNADHVIYSLGGKISAVLDGGPCEVGIESTILDLSSDNPSILRVGPITARQIEEVLGKKVKVPTKHFELLPGNMKKHYQPNTQTRMMSTEQINSYILLPSVRNKKIGILHYSDLSSEGDNIINVRASVVKDLYAKELYRNLHYLDSQMLEEIIVEIPPNGDEWSDVIDRLNKAVAF